MKSENSGTNIIDRGIESIENYGVCGKMNALMSEAGGYQGMLEYIPGKYAHRPIEAEGYIFIHCLFVGFRNEFKGKGYATLLIKTDTDRIFDNPDWAGKSPKSAGTGRSRQLFLLSTAA